MVWQCQSPADVMAPRLSCINLQRGPYFQAFDGSVALPVAGYNYNSVWTPLLAGLPPAGMAASLAAPDPDVQISRFRFFMGEPRSWWCTDGQFEALAEGSA